MAKIKDSLYIIMAGILWGIISIFVNGLSKIGFSSMQIVSVRVLFSAIILFVFILIKDKNQLKIKLKDLPLFFGTGVCSIIFFNYCYFEAINIIGGASVPALLLYTAPVFVMIMSVILFKEKITVQKIISLCLTLIGLFFVTGAFSNAEKLSVKAVLLGLGAGLGYALYSIFGKFLVDKYSSLTITFYTFVVASCFSVPFSGIIFKFKDIVSLSGLFYSICLALVCTCLPFLFYIMGLKKVQPSKASILATVEPLTASVTGVLFLNEKITMPKVIGIIMVLAAIIILNLKIKKKNIQEE